MNGNYTSQRGNISTSTAISLTHTQSPSLCALIHSIVNVPANQALFNGV